VDVDVDCKLQQSDVWTMSDRGEGQDDHTHIHTYVHTHLGAGSRWQQAALCSHVSNNESNQPALFASARTVLASSQPTSGGKTRDAHSM
jgi:hypothetical protein